MWNLRDGDGNIVRSSCEVITDIDHVFTGEGPTRDAAILDAMAKAAAESDEARAELGILLGVRGGRAGGRPPNED